MSIQQTLANTAALKRPMWALQKGRTLSQDGFGGNRFGGSCWLYDDEKVVKDEHRHDQFDQIVTLRDGRIGRFIFQLDIASLPTPLSERLGGKGIVQVFHDFISKEMHLFSRIVRDAADSGAVEANYRGISLEGFLPLKSELPGDDDNDAIADLDVSYLASFTNDKLGGWSSWTHRDRTPVDASGKRMMQVIQLDSWMWTRTDKPRVVLIPSLSAIATKGYDNKIHLFVSQSNPDEIALVHDFH